MELTVVDDSSETSNFILALEIKIEINTHQDVRVV